MTDENGDGDSFKNVKLEKIILLSHLWQAYARYMDSTIVKCAE